MEAASHKARINELISHLGLSKNKFAQSIGTSSAMISKVTTQDINYGVDLAGKIISTFPSVNPTWLLTGIGEMMLPEPEQKPESNRNISHGKRPQVFISHSQQDTTLAALLAARVDYRGRPAYYYEPEDKIYNYYTTLSPDEVEQLIEDKLDELLDVLVDYNFTAGMVNLRRNSSIPGDTLELVTFGRLLSNIEEEALGEYLAPDTSPKIRRLVYLFQVEEELRHWRNAISQEIRRLADLGFSRIDAYTATYGKSYPYGKYPSAKQLAEGHQEPLQGTSEAQPAEEARASV